MMSRTTGGWVVFLAAVAMLFSLMGAELMALQNPSDVYTLAFVGKTMLHFATVITAFVGGKLIPESRNPDMRSRASDVTVTRDGDG